LDRSEKSLQNQGEKGWIRKGRGTKNYLCFAKNLDPREEFLLFYGQMEVEGSTGRYLILGIWRLLRATLSAIKF